MSDKSNGSGAREIDSVDLAALRTCAEVCWRRRSELRLDDQQLEQVLIAWIAVGSPDESAAASELLASRREADRKQATFDALLGGHP